MAGWDEGNRIMEELAEHRTDPEKTGHLAELHRLTAEVSLAQAEQFIRDSPERNAKRLREAIERLRVTDELEPMPAPLPVETPDEWVARMRLEAALSQAVQVAIHRPRLVVADPKLSPRDRAIDAGQQIAAMAKVFAAMLAGG